MKRTLVNVTSVFSGEFFARLVTFFIPILIARAYDSSALGKYSFGLACAALAALIPDLGLHLLTTREIAANHEKLEEYFWNVQILKLFLLVAMAVTVWGFGQLAISDTESRWIVNVLALRMGLLSISHFFMSIIKAFERMQYLLLLQVCNYSTVFLFLVIGLYKKVSLLTLLCAFLPGQTLEVIIGGVLISRLFGRLPFSRVEWDTMKSISKAAIPIGLTNILLTMNLRLDVIVLSWFRPSSDVGLFSAANVLTAGSFLPASLSMTVAFPKLSRLAKYSQADFRHYVETFARFSLFFLIPAATLVFLGASTIIHLLYGSQFTQSVPFLKVLSFAMPMIFLNTVFFFALVAQGRRATYLRIITSGVAVNLLVNPLLTAFLGAIGTAISNLLRESTMLFLYAFLSCRLGSNLFSPKIFAKPTISLILHVGLGLVLIHLGLGSVVVLLSVLAVYLFVMCFSNGFPKKQDLLFLSR